MSTAVSVLETRLGQAIGDDLEVICTTPIAATNLIVSTNLTSYDSGRDDYFNEQWVYITDKANAGVLRQVSDYATATGTLTVRGAALATDVANLATIRLHRYDRTKYITAFNDTSREISDVLFKSLDVSELVTGNILPNSHFRDWTLTTVPDKWALSSANITCTALTTAGLTRGGAKSMNAVTGAAGAASYVYVTSDSNPRLLDLMGKTVSAYVWVYPQTANDATIVIYTLKADSTAQTLTSTTTCPATKWTRLKLESQTLNDDLVKVEVRLAIATNSQYVYFDHAKLYGGSPNEYLLPLDFKAGNIARVEVQTSGYSDDPSDDLKPTHWETDYSWSLMNDGTDVYLRLSPYYPDKRLIRLIGHAPMTTVTAYTDTVEVDGDRLNLFIAYAKYKLYQAIEGPVSSQDVSRYESNSAKAYNEYLRLLPKKRMHSKSTMKIHTY